MGLMSATHVFCMYLICRYETELTHPVRNLLAGELARALLIQVESCTLSVIFSGRIRNE